MTKDTTICKWSDLYEKAVLIPDEGRNAGVVEDFYFQDDTNAIYALLVRTRVEGDYALPITGIKAIDKKNISVINAQMLTEALPPLPRGKSLPGRRVVGESGIEVGTVNDIWLNVNYPQVLSIAAFELAPRDSRHSKAFTAHEVVRYEDDTIVIHDQAAKKLR